VRLKVRFDINEVELSHENVLIEFHRGSVKLNKSEKFWE